MYQKSGFTLIELLVVVLIIGILAAVALPQYEKAVLKTRAAAGLAVVKAFQLAQREYFLANGRFSDSLEGLSLGFDGMTWAGGVFQVQVQNGKIMWEVVPTEKWSSLNVYCLAEKDNHAAQSVCKSYGKYSYDSARYQYYYVQSLSTY